MKMQYLLAAMAAVVPAALHAQVLMPSQDSFVVVNHNLNSGGAQFIDVQSLPNLLGIQAEGLVQFNLSSLPAGLTASGIAHATLTLYASQVNNPGNVNVFAANGTWTEGTVNGFNAPAPGAVVATNVPVTTQYTFITVDVTTAVRNWVGGITPNDGFLIQAAGPGTDVFFDSKENIATSQPAMLSLVLTGTGSGAQGAVGPTGAAGSVGPAGPAGANGPQGVAGVAGAKGATGATGPTGLTGATGAQGPVGANGSPGATGAQGPAGTQGPAGSQGIAGTPGAIGPQGPAGANGLNGVNGTPGATGPAGPAGSGGGGALQVLTVTVSRAAMLNLNQTAITLIPAAPGVVNIPTRITVQVDNAFYLSASTEIHFAYGAINATPPPYPNSAGLLFAPGNPIYLDDVAFPPPLTGGDSSLFVNQPYIAYTPDVVGESGGTGGNVIFTVWYTTTTLQ